MNSNLETPAHLACGMAETGRCRRKDAQGQMARYQFVHGEEKLEVQRIADKRVGSESRNPRDNMPAAYCGLVQVLEIPCSVQRN